MKKPEWLKRPNRTRPPVKGVYIIVAPSGETYVGGSGDCYDRCITHSGRLRRRKHESPKLQAVADLYGEATLVFDVVEQLAQAEMLQAEQRWIDQLKADGRVVLNQLKAGEPPQHPIPRNTSVNHCPPRRVRGVHEETNHVLEFPSGAEAGRNGFNQGTISACCRGKLKAHKGYRWEFID